jgi:hypothetical protein
MVRWSSARRIEDSGFRGHHKLATHILPVFSRPQISNVPDSINPSGEWVYRRMRLEKEDIITYVPSTLGASFVAAAA